MFEKKGTTLLKKTNKTLGQLSKLSFDNRPPSNPPSSTTFLRGDSESSELRNQLGFVDVDADCGEKEFILSQYFFCTPDLHRRRCLLRVYFNLNLLRS
ncbi:hypothetical protein AALP_AAs53926U000100, partial [Arabis alpina]